MNSIGVVRKIVSMSPRVLPTGTLNGNISTSELIINVRGNTKEVNDKVVQMTKIKKKGIDYLKFFVRS